MTAASPARPRPKTPEPAVAAAATPQRLEVVHLPIGDLRPNPWNPNRVPAPVMTSRFSRGCVSPSLCVCPHRTRIRRFG